MKRKCGALAACLCLAIAAGAAAAFFSGQPGTQSQGLSRGIVAWLFGLFGQEPTPETLGCGKLLPPPGRPLVPLLLYGIGALRGLSVAEESPGLAACHGAGGGVRRHGRVSPAVLRREDGQAHRCALGRLRFGGGGAAWHTCSAGCGRGGSGLEVCLGFVEGCLMACGAKRKG